MRSKRLTQNTNIILITPYSRNFLSIFLLFFSKNNKTQILSDASDRISPDLGMGA